MALVLLIFTGIWIVGARMKASRQERWLVIALLYTIVIALQIMLPEGARLRQITGGSAGAWLVLGGMFALVAGYRMGLSRLRGKVAPSASSQSAGGDAFSQAELERYARHIVLREIGGVGQKQLKAAKVLVVGAGGLGSPALLYLAGSGVGTIGVIDDDDVALSNLARQVIHTDARSDMPKVFSAQIAMKALNPHVEVRPYHRKLDDDIAKELIETYDLVLDGCDNFATRQLVNRACVATQTPLISGAITGWEGQVSLFDPARGAPCYACLHPHEPADGLAPSCTEGGVAGPLPGIIGAMMALEAVKVITGAGEPLLGRLLIHDALSVETRVLRLKRAPECPVCHQV